MGKYQLLLLLLLLFLAIEKQHTFSSPLNITQSYH